MKIGGRRGQAVEESGGGALEEVEHFLAWPRAHVERDLLRRRDVLPREPDLGVTEIEQRLSASRQRRDPHLGGQDDVRRAGIALERRRGNGLDIAEELIEPNDAVGRIRAGIPELHGNLDRGIHGERRV